MGAVTLVGVGSIVWGTLTATPGSAGTPSNGDQPYILAVSKDPGTFVPFAPAGWSLVPGANVTVNAAGAVTGNQGPMRIQVMKRDTLVSGGSITWPAVDNDPGGGGAAQVIGVVSVLARPAAGEALTESATSGEDLDGGTSCVTTGATSLDFGVGDLAIALSAICDNGVTTSGGAITASGITFGATTERVDGSTGNGNDEGCYVHSAAVTSGTATSAPVLTQTLSSSSALQNRVGTVFLRIRSVVTTVEFTVTDTVGITDTARIGLPLADTVGIADTATAGEHVPAADAATISETVSITGSQPAPDTVSISEQVGLLGTFTTTDTVGVADVAKVGPLGADTVGVADALTNLIGHQPAPDTITVSDGVAIEELFGSLVVAIFAVDPDTGDLTPLPDHQSLTLSRERNGAGSISLTYPVDGDNFNVLRDTITNDRDLEVEIWTVGTKTGALRGFLQEASGDDVKEDRTWTFAGGFAEVLIGEAVCYPAPIITTTTTVTTTRLSEDPPEYEIVTKTTVMSSAGGPAVTTTVTTTASTGSEGVTSTSKSTNGDLEFNDATPGALAITLVEQAQDRGALDGLELGFTATHDSAGVLWPDTITTKFSPGSPYDQVLGRMIDFGLAEWGVTWTGTAYRLDLWVIFGRGIDRTVGVRPIVLRKARNLLDAPRKWTVRDSGTSMLSSGAEGVYKDADDVDALARRGRRIERATSANNLTTPEAVEGFAQNQLHLIAVGQLEITHGIGFLPGEPRPVIAFDIGDWIYSQSSAGLERLRVVQWTLAVDADSGASGTVTLNDTITDWLSRLKAQLANLTSGDTVVGTSEGSGGQDIVAPLPPEVVSADSVAFLDGTLGVRAAVTVAWDGPVVNTDGSVITDLDHFNVQFALATSADVWNAGITVAAPADHATFTAPAGETITIRVNAVDRNGNTSVWSDPPFPITTAADDIPPPIPSAAVVTEFLGTVRITWDGLTEDAAVMSETVDFDHIEVHLSPGSLFTPSDATLVGRMYGLGTFTVTDLPYGTTQFARFVAVDWSDNKSDPSAQGSATPAQVVSDDVFDGAIGTAKLADLAVVTAKIANLAVNDAKIGSLSVGKLTAGSLTVDVILAGGGIKTATSGTRLEADSAGLRLYNGANVVVDLKTSNGSALVVGEFRTSLTGQRIVFNPSGALPDTMNFYPNASGDFARIMSRTAPADGTAAILIDGGAANGQPRGRLGAYKSEAFISFVTNDAGGDTSAGFSRTAVSSQTNNIISWVQTLFGIDHYSGSSVIGGSRVQVMWVNGSVSNCGAITQPGQDAGLRFDDGALNATKGNGTTAAPMVAASFPVASTRTVKTDEATIAVNTTELVRRVSAKQWRYRFEVDDNPDAPLHFGPIAEDVAAYMPDLVIRARGLPSIDVRDEVGVLWDVVHNLIGRIDGLEGRAA